MAQTWLPSCNLVVVVYKDILSLLPTPARVICCFTDWCNENTEVAVRSKNFIREPLTRLEMNDIVRQVDFIKR